MDGTDLYEKAHLIVAAIRILEFKNNTPPNMDEICHMLSISVEQGNFLCNNLNRLGILNVVETASDTRIFIKNHLRIEELPTEKKDDGLKEELDKFFEGRKTFIQKIETIKEEQNEKKKDLFAKLNERLKEDLKK